MNGLLPWLGLFTAGFIAACGGKVVVDATGNGGAGGTGGGTTTSTLPSTGSFPPPDTAQSTGTGPMDLCAQLCAFWDTANCPMNNCAGQCAETFQSAGDCTDELTTVIQCILDHPGPAGVCFTPAACDGAIETFQVCAGGNACDELECFASSDGSCGCAGTCFGLAVDVQCMNDLCTCSANGMQVGVCKEIDPTCGPLGGCCSGIFFPPDG